jgi:hypothetical protein
MSSEQSPDRFDLERDLPTTPEDLRALRENRPQPGPDWLDQLSELSEQFPESEQARWKRRTFEGCEPFEL